MSDDENGVKGNKGDFVFPVSSTKPPKRKRVGSGKSVDGGAKIIIALLAGAGAAFLLALMMLMSRLEAEEMSNGLLNTNVGGAKGIDDQIISEEIAQGHASIGLMSKDRQKERRNKLVTQMKTMKKGYDKKLAKFTRMAGLKPGNPLEKMVHEGESHLGDVVKALNGEGKMPGRIDLKKDFRDAIHEDNEKIKKRNEKKAKKESIVLARKELKNLKPDLGGSEKAPHLYPHFPPMPPHTMAEDLFGEEIITNTLSYDKPTIAGIIAILQRFLRKLHQMLVENRDEPSPKEVIVKYFALVNEYLAPLEEAYRDRPMFPIREDGSVFMSLGAYRDHLLGETLRQAYKTAAYPDKLFIGAVVQNCFGIGAKCR